MVDTSFKFYFSFDQSLEINNLTSAHWELIVISAVSSTEIRTDAVLFIYWNIFVHKKIKTITKIGKLMIKKYRLHW